jgi:hypothetical protein
MNLKQGSMCNYVLKNICHAKKIARWGNGVWSLSPNHPQLRHCRFYLHRVNKYDRRD